MGLKLPPAAFGRLCVETERTRKTAPNQPPAAFGRLCVETIRLMCPHFGICPAAFGRLCVETTSQEALGPILLQPPSGGCVLKRRLPRRSHRRRNQPPSGGCVLKPPSLLKTA